MNLVIQGQDVSTPDLKALQSNVDAVAEMGFFKTSFKVTDYADLTIVDEAVKRLK